MIHIVHLVLGLDVGGLERVVLRLVERADRARFKVSVCALTSGGQLEPELRGLRVPLVVSPRRHGADPLLVGRLARMFRAQRPDIVHTHNPAPHLYGALAATLARGYPGGALARVIHTKHGRNHPDDARKVILNRVASALSDRIVAVSDEARGVVLQAERIDAGKVLTIHNGVDTSAFRPAADKDGLRRRLGLRPSAFLLGCVARLSPEKDHATLLEAFARLVRRAEGVRLCVVGDGILRASLERRVRDLHIEDTVDFLGMRADVAELMGAFDAFVLASKTEGISLTLLEAAASGLPIIATSVGGNGEIVRAGQSGWLVPASDPEWLAAALLRCYKATDRAAMGLRGRAHVIEHFGVDAMVRSYESLYTEIHAAYARQPPRERRRASLLGGAE